MSVEITGKLNFIPGIASIEGTWKPDKSQKDAAWELYIELITRISVQPLPDKKGIKREALDSLYELFQTTRDILKEYGPSVAPPEDSNSPSFGVIAVAVLNNRLRPFLAKWHPALEKYEQNRPSDKSVKEHEEEWEDLDQLNSELNELQEDLLSLADVLAEANNIYKIHRQIGEED